MRFLAFHRYRPYGTGNLFVQALEKEEHFVWVRNTERRFPTDGTNYHWLKDLKWYKENMGIEVVLGIGCQDLPPDEFEHHVEEAGLISACWVMDDPTGWNGGRNQKIAEKFDIVFVAQKEQIPGYKSIVKNANYVRWLNFGANPDIWHPLNRPKLWDMYHCGASYSAYEYDKREGWMGRLFNEGHNVRSSYGVYLHDYNMELNKSKIGYNNAFTDEINMRCYEVMMAGTMLLTNKIAQGFDEIFEDGKHCVTYEDNYEDMKEKFLWYNSHKMQRELIAQTGYNLVMDKYTYQHRVREMIKVIEEFLK